MCTQCTLQLPETNTFYMQCILGVIIIIWLKKITIIKLFYFLSPNVLLLFVFKIALLNVLIFLRNSVLCILLSNEGIKTSNSFIFKLLKIKCFLANKTVKQMKRSNAHEVTLRAVPEMLFECLCPHWDATRDSVRVCVQKENARLISCIISACEQSIAGRRSVKEISCTTACHSTAALLQTGTSTSILMLHRHFLSAGYLSGLSFSGKHEQ